MRQYLEIKNRNKNTVLLYRMGDFFEMFNEDAKIAAQVLGLTLTSRNHGAKEQTPLAGFPHHALDRYANRLVKAGYKIAICEQTEDPKKAKGIVKRDIVEIITAGTATEEQFIDETSNNYILGLLSENGNAGLAICDLSTGEFLVEELADAKLEEELVRIDPSEILIADADDNPVRSNLAGLLNRPVVSEFDAWKFDYDHAAQALCEHFQIASLQGKGLESYTHGVQAAGALLLYLKEQKKNDLRNISDITLRQLSNYAELNPSSIRNLELLKPLHAEDSGGTLVSVLDKTNSAMGARLLKRWITHPLQTIGEIEARLDCVAFLKSDLFARGEASMQLKSVADVERLISRVMFERANGRDLIALKNSLQAFPRLIKTLSSCELENIQSIVTTLYGFDDLIEVIEKTLVDSPPLSVREGGLIRQGVSKDLDEYKDAAVNGKQWIARLQETERRRTGIASLKVGYNKVFGYYIEVSKANIDAVPAEYIRKQTLVNGERYITPDLKEVEDKIMGAQDKLSAIEYELFVDLRKQVALRCTAIQKAADGIAELDVYLSFAKVAADNRYCRPELSDGLEIDIKDGRHPVVEVLQSGEEFVPNDVHLNHDEAQIILITGPNMAGKSTYLRQNALIVLMAQIGCFVPASFAGIGIVDKFFTRVGASDRLVRGQSTFLVEMIEVANILNNATDRSLVLLDEVGRGTSTFDGISIAWAVAEYLHESHNRRARTLFATHYHELTELELLFARIKNMHVKVKEWNDQIIFLRKIDEGSCDHSYGIQVARLAGVPKKLIIRAKEILANLEEMELTPDKKPALARHDGKYPHTLTNDAVQTDLFFQHQQWAPQACREIVDKLYRIDTNTLTPLQALNILHELHTAALEEKKR
ncbi:MAG: DNA mismatch repair protein MutS [Chitinivibrionales bacterium]|nr:DNA mismatch repair protein MutS [Chitinivibrionales bacterium]